MLLTEGQMVEARGVEPLNDLIFYKYFRRLFGKTHTKHTTFFSFSIFRVRGSGLGFSVRIPFRKHTASHVLHG